MDANAKTGTTQSAFGTAGPETLESMAALGRDAFERTMRMTAEATVRACRGAAAASTAQLEAAQALREKMGNGTSENASALSATSEAAIAGMETCMEKAIEFTRANADAGIEAVGRTLAAKTMDEWLTVQFDSATRMMNLGLAQASEFARIVTDTSTRCADPLKARVEDTVQAS